MCVYTVFDALIYSHLNIHKCIFLHTKSTVSTNCHPCSLCSVLRVINKKFANTISSIDGQTDRPTDGRTHWEVRSVTQLFTLSLSSWLTSLSDTPAPPNTSPAAPTTTYYLIIGDHHIISQDRWNCVLIAKMPEDGYVHFRKKMLATFTCGQKFSSILEKYV